MRFNGALRSFRNLSRLASTKQKESKHQSKQQPQINQPTKCTAASTSRSNSVNVTLESAIQPDSRSLRSQSTTSILSSVFKHSASTSSSSSACKAEPKKSGTQVAYILTTTGLQPQPQPSSGGGSSGELNAQTVCQSALQATYKLTTASSMRTSTALINSDQTTATITETSSSAVGQHQPLTAIATTAATAFQTSTSLPTDSCTTVNMENLNIEHSTNKRSMVDSRSIDNRNQPDSAVCSTTVNIGDPTTANQSEPANPSSALSSASSNNATTNNINSSNFAANQPHQTSRYNSTNLTNNSNLVNTCTAPVLTSQTSTDTASDFKSDSSKKQSDQHHKHESTSSKDHKKDASTSKVAYSKYPQPTTTPANSPPLQQPILLNCVGCQQPNVPMRNVQPLSAHNPQIMNTETILHTAAAAVTANAVASALSSQLNAPLHNQRSLQSGSNDSDCSDRQLSGQGKRSKNSLENFHIPNEGRRLGKRKQLFEKRKRISDYCLVMALFGIFMMIAENELTSASVFTKVSVAFHF